MKKKNFIDGAIISTLCLIVCKILGLVYVIPFYKIIGSKGGALYSYAYSIYAVFLNLSTVGIPSAIAKIISEYDTLSFKYWSKHGVSLSFIKTTFDANPLLKAIAQMAVKNNFFIIVYFNVNKQINKL